MSLTDDAAGNLAEQLGEQAGTDPSAEAPEGTQPPEGSPSAAPSQPAYDTNGLSPYAQNWLASIPETERPQAAQHVRNWDQGFQRYAQGVQSQLSPYTTLGSVDELTTMKNIVENLKADPQGFVQLLIDNGLVNAPGSAATQAQQPQQFYDANGNPVAAPQQPPDFAQHPEFKRMQQALGVTAQQLTSMREAQEAKEQDAKLESYMQDLEKTHGNFNRLYVYQMMANGLDGPAAVQAWKNELASFAQQQKPAPKIMGASSAPPVAPGPLNTSEERTDALAKWIQSQQ